MATMIGLYEGGTTGDRDGTLLSYADAETNAYAFAALNTEYTLHYRVIESTDETDPTEDTDATFTITAPTGVQVSATSGSGFGSSATLAAATGGNQPVYVKQTAAQASSEADLEVGTGGVTFTSGSRVAAITDLAATAGDEQTSLSWSAVSGADGHEYRYSDDGGSTWSAWAETSSSTAQTVSGLTNGTEYTFEVRGYDERGVGTADSDTATPGWGTLIYANTFDSETTDALPSGWTDSGTNEWLVKTPGLASSTKALRVTGDGSSWYADYDFTARSRVRAYFTAKSGSSVTTGKRYGTYYLKDGTSAGGVVALKDGYIQCYHSGSWTNITSMATNTEYELILDYDGSTQTYTVTVDGTLYDNGGSGYSYGSVTQVSRFEASSGVVPSGSYAYIDELTLRYG